MGNQSKYAVISDAHANAEALRSVLKDIKERQIQDVFFLGDAVGYGPEPNECVELLSAECRIMIAGNHDWGLLGLTDPASFNENARIALAWTRGVLTTGNREILRRSPLKAEIREMAITLVHATPDEPQQWHYLLKLSDAKMSFQYMQTDICFIGHSHKPFIIEMQPEGELCTHKQEMRKKTGCRYIVNAGSIGQPRDGDPRACYAMVDDGRIELVRVGYDIGVTQKRMGDAGLPEFLIERLSYGL
ncbi:MAG: metallophosphatase family protein [Nitrospirota bacterium]|nr:metallophosphatase family protein [Nitrospirota bacterium]